MFVTYLYSLRANMLVCVSTAQSHKHTYVLINIHLENIDKINIQTDGYKYEVSCEFYALPFAPTD